MPTSWSNWSGKLEASPSEIIRVASEQDVIDAVRGTHGPIRCVGAAHSHAPLVGTEGIILDMAGLSGVRSVDPNRLETRLAAGTRIHDLGEPLRAEGVALLNQGDIDRQAIAGAVATGTHGTGKLLRNLSSSVRGVRLVLATGEVVELDAATEPDLFPAAQLSLGALGVVTEVRLAVREAFRLEERMWLEDLDEVLDRIDALTEATRHFEFFWTPGYARAACKSLSETDEEPRYPLAEEGQRLAWSYDVLANHRPLKHTEMEYSLPAEHGPTCLRQIRDLVASDFPDLAWPVEFRTLAADDVWLSSAYGRPTVTISVHQGIDAEDEPLFRACEEVFRRHDGRPHWGKVHYLDGATMSRIHERWSDWWTVRDRLDPDGRFLNEHLHHLRP